MQTRLADRRQLSSAAFCVLMQNLLPPQVFLSLRQHLKNRSFQAMRYMAIIQKTQIRLKLPASAFSKHATATLRLPLKSGQCTRARERLDDHNWAGNTRCSCEVPEHTQLTLEQI